MIKSILFRLYLRGKVKLNYILDRIIDLSDMILMDAYRLPWPIAQNVAKKTARHIGDISWLLRDFPRLSAYKLAGANWTIVFVGSQQGLLEIRHLFFADETIAPQKIGRIALWRLSAQTQKWLAEDVDLVICELSPISPWIPKSLLTFTIPPWIYQVLVLPTPLETLLTGRRIEGIRRKIKKAQVAGFAYRFSQSKTDFDYFYYHMYTPFIKNRHGNLALITPYQHQWQRWFTRGGLVLVINKENKPVAGMLCYIANRTCFYIEGGILEARPDLFQQGINAVNIWYAIEWAYRHGAKIFNLGGTSPWRTNGSFIFKQRWGARVARRKRIYGERTFLAQNLLPSLQEHINKLGFISEIDGKFCSVLLSTDGIPVTQSDIEQELSAVGRQGLDGLVVVSNNNHQVILCNQKEITQ
ncbi:MAG: GNAT family N-acetyltransferase [Anaerolineae bacterium]|nr:GNAT family N-acetyltransferase [Anaerolineae bacterium]